MKKIYLTPEMEEMEFEAPVLLDGSGGEAETGSETTGGAGDEGDDAG